MRLYDTGSQATMADLTNIILDDTALTDENTKTRTEIKTDTQGKITGTNFNVL